MSFITIQKHIAWGKNILKSVTKNINFIKSSLGLKKKN